MMNKRIGKLKQWTGEKLGGQQKTELSEDFQSLEQDVELRKSGVDRLYAVSKEYTKHYTKKIEVDDTGKVLPSDALGLIFESHGDEFGNDSAFGQALVAFGKAQQQLANVTATYTDYLHSGWLTSLEKTIAQMAEYAAQRKKLDSRRLTYDAMLAKVQKSKKEKRELEDDLRVAKNRYEETSEEVSERAVAIQDGETDQLAQLTKLLDSQSSWIDEQKRIMDDLKRHWVDQGALKINRKKVTAHAFGIESAPAPKVAIKGKAAPSLTARSAVRNGRSKVFSDSEDGDDHHAPPSEEEHEEEEEDHDPLPRRSKASNKSSRSVPVTREPSLKEKPSPHSRFGGVRMPGLPSARPASIHSDEPTSPPSRRASNNKQSSHTPQPLSPGLRRSQTAPPKPLKMLKAKWAYAAAASDELELAPGDRVRVTSEVNQEWYIGTNESTGETGMFPAAYCLPVDTGPSHKFLIPEKEDAFADPHEADEDDEARGSAFEEDEDESAALKPNRSNTLPLSRDQPRRMPSLAGNSSASAISSGKRAPPPPPNRRATTIAPIKPSSSSGARPVSSIGTGETTGDQPEAFGSVSELKKRLGMNR